ncbi:hypothetical protein FDF40_03655 [Clostridium sporogenes]|uniref:hypothetical protein n=1 Tax=Bacillota TaxID=1239 RepID=UPI0011BDD4CC|nr:MULTISPECIES: hypothetical protein [Bacillota]NFT30572.1 hypothetical protein [Clostridium sporogenes]TWM14726.1 hypothetical protein CHCC15091_1767 [Bacillus licheniformis]GIN25550.1 hypothetical protein J31TS2_21300 [Bacillus licheniformis]GIN29711.1 hypothetical protein J2TS5_17500 [Bacillus licheniformis]
MVNKNFDSNEEIDQEENDIKYKKLYKDVKKNLKNAEKEIQKKSKETSRLSLDTKEKDKEISKLKKTIHEMSSGYDGLERKFKELEKEKTNVVLIEFGGTYIMVTHNQMYHEFKDKWFTKR